MQKIPTLYVRDFEHDHGRYVTDIVTPGCEWAVRGEGKATRKYDGTCVLLDEYDIWWARREVKSGKAVPSGFRAISTDVVTGKTIGWEPINQSSFVRYHAEALSAVSLPCNPGTYELCGPKINRNPEGYSQHTLIRHDDAEVITLSAVPKDLVYTVAIRGWEGIVWHHPDGRMTKLKVRDLRT